MSDLFRVAPLRANPFIDEDNDSLSEHSPFFHGESGSYNERRAFDANSFQSSDSLPRIPSTSTMDSDLVEDHYSVLMPHIGIHSSMDDLEKAVHELKLLFLDECEDSPRRGKIMERLIELRQQLHCLKETHRNALQLDGGGVGDSHTTDSTNSAVISQSVPVSRTSVVGSTIVAAGNGASSVHHSPSIQRQQSILRLRGHEFVPTASPRHWAGGYCEQCCGHVIAKWFYRCSHCSALLHNAKVCTAKLKRSCPLMDIAPENWLNTPNEGRRTRTRIFSNQHLLNLHSPHLFASLLQQEFKCAECFCPLGEVDPAFNTEPVSSPARSNLHHFFSLEAQHIVAAIASAPLTAYSKIPWPGYYSPVVSAGAAAAVYSASTSPPSGGSLSPPLSSSKSTMKRPLARVCHYTHQLYCPQCHWGDKHTLPAHVLLLGDCEPHGVCRAAYLRLRCLWRLALFRAPDSWILYQPQAWETFTWRHKIRKSFVMLRSCAGLKNIKAQLDERYGHYFLEQPYTFSMRDVLAVLENKLRQVLEFCIKNLLDHINFCETCLGLCSSCHVCQSESVLNPLSADVNHCAECDRIVHVFCCASLRRSENKFQSICLSCEQKSS